MFLEVLFQYFQSIFLMGRLMSMTLSEKIIAQACGRSNVNSGDIVTCKVDLAMMHDSSGPRMAGKMLDELGVPVWDVDKLVVISSPSFPSPLDKPLVKTPFL